MSSPQQTEGFQCTVCILDIRFVLPWLFALFRRFPQPTWVWQGHPSCLWAVVRAWGQDNDFHPQYWQKRHWDTVGIFPCVLFSQFTSTSVSESLDCSTNCLQEVKNHQPTKSTLNTTLPNPTTLHALSNWSGQSGLTCPLFGSATRTILGYLLAFLFCQPFSLLEKDQQVVINSGDYIFRRRFMYMYCTCVYMY